MRRFIYSLGCCLLISALLAGRPVFADPAMPKASKDTAKSEGEEKPKAGNEAQGTEKAKPKAETEKPASPKPATHTVEKEPLKIEVTLDGVFEAQKMTEVSLEAEAWSAFEEVANLLHVETKTEPIEDHYEAYDRLYKLYRSYYQILKPSFDEMDV